MLAGSVSDDPRVPALTSAGGVGALIGGLTVALRRPSAPGVTPAAVRPVLLSGAVAAPAWDALWLPVLLIAAAGALQLGVMAHCDAMVQRVIDNSHLGRVRSLYGLPRGGLLPGVGWHVVGPTVALGGSGRVGLALATCLPAPDPAAGTPSVHNVPAVRPSTVNRYPGGMPIIRVNRTYR